MTEQSKVEIRKEFDEKAIQWGLRTGVTDTAVAKVLYWCVVNVYALQSKIEEIREVVDRIENLGNDLIKKGK